jgi:hypothetical protein
VIETIALFGQAVLRVGGFMGGRHYSVAELKMLEAKRL